MSNTFCSYNYLATVCSYYYIASQIFRSSCHLIGPFPSICCITYWSRSFRFFISMSRTASNFFSSVALILSIKWELLFPQGNFDISIRPYSHKCESHLLFMCKETCGTIKFPCGNIDSLNIICLCFLPIIFLLLVFLAVLITRLAKCASIAMTNALCFNSW